MEVDNGNHESSLFSMYPTTIQDLMDIADAGKVMPPKSTWFEPKLLVAYLSISCSKSNNISD